MNQNEIDELKKAIIVLEEGGYHYATNVLRKSLHQQERHIEMINSIEENEKKFLLKIEESYNHVMSYDTDPHKRAVKLAELMTSMESYYHIPLVGKERIEEFQKEHSDVWELYSLVSRSRSY